MEEEPKYKEGDIVDVPYGMHLIKKGMPRKLWVHSKQKQKTEAQVEVGDDDDLGDYNEASSDGEDKDDEGKVYDSDAGTDSDSSTVDDSDAEESKPLKRCFETQEDYVRKEVPIYKTSAGEFLANNMGLPIKHEQWLPIKVRREVFETQIVYAGTYRMQVGPKGELLPLKSEKRVVGSFDDALLLTKQPIKNYEPTLARSLDPGSTRFIAPSTNKLPPVGGRGSTFNIGDYVKFTKDGKDHQGVITSSVLEEIGVVVLTFSTKGILTAPARTEFVRRDDPTLLVTKIPKRVTARIGDLTADEVMVMTIIPNDIRRMVIDLYTEIYNTIKSTTTMASVSTTSSVKKAMGGSTRIGPPIGWETYYSEELYHWTSTRYHDLFVSQVDPQQIATLASDTVKQELNTDTLINEIIVNLPHGLTHDTDIDVIIEAMNKVKNITVFQALTIQTFQREKYNGRGSLKGADLAQLLAGIIETYHRTYPPDIDAQYKQIFDAAMEIRRHEYQPTEADLTEFDGLYLDHLWKLYEEALVRFENEQLEVDALNKEKSKVGVLVEVGDANRDEVVRFEQIIFAAHGSNVYNYLSNVLLPHIFLEGPLAKFAKFFQAKVASGKFPFTSLTGLNIAYYLPEFAMNRNLSDDDWMSMSESLGALLHNDIRIVVDSYINMLNPTAKVSHTGLSYSTINGVMASIEPLLIDPISVCQVDTGTGMRPVVIDGRYTYLPRSEVLREERIPDDDLSVCYNKDTKAFTCISTRDLILSIARGETSDPRSGAPYSPDLVARIKEKYDLSNVQQPQPAEVDTIVPVIAKVGVATRPKSLPKVVAPVKKRLRHKAPKKGDYDSITNMLLLGDVERPALFGSTFSFNIVDDDPDNLEGTEEEIPITYNLKAKRINVAVVTVYVDDASTLKEMKDQLAQVPKTVKRIYIAALNTEDTSPKEQMLLAGKLKKLNPNIKKVFFAEGMTEEDILDVLIDVAIDVEGVVAV